MSEPKVADLATFAANVGEVLGRQVSLEESDRSFADQGFDSLDYLVMSVFMADAGAEIPDEMLPTIDCVDALYHQYITRRTAEHDNC